MRKGTKISLWIALCLVISGILLIAVGGMIMGFNFDKLDTATYIERNETVEGFFTDIEIDCAASDVTVLPSPDGVCRVVSRLNQDVDYSVSVDNGKLKVQYGPFEWYRHLGIHFLKKVYITVYLPEKQYQSLKLTLRSGDISVRDLQIEKSEIETISGDVKVNDWNGDLLDIETTSGDVLVLNSNVRTLAAKTVSGDIEMEDTLAKEKMTLSCTSGDIEFERIDAKTMELETTSGDIEGTLLSVKHFVADTTSGDIHIPDADSSAGKCTANTTSGDIDIRVAK
jgi:lia operon protein LiaG